MPVFAFLVGLGGLAVWLAVLALPLGAFAAMVALVASLFGAPLNGAVGMGLAATLLPAIIYVPIIVFVFLVPVLSQLIARLVTSPFGGERFTPLLAVALVDDRRRKTLSLFGIAPRPARTRG